MLAGGYVIVWDCESDCAFDKLPGETHEEKLCFMQFTVICAILMPSAMIKKRAPVDLIMQNSTRYSWWRDVAEHGSNPVVSLLRLFDEADMIVGYNCLEFDFPLIRRFYRPSKSMPCSTQRYVNHRAKTLDIMARVRDATGKYYKLDDLLKKNGLETKSSNGIEAIRMWEQGQRDELESYCETDVLLTARLSLLEEIRVGHNVKVTSSVFGARNELLCLPTASTSNTVTTSSTPLEEEGDFVLVQSAGL